MHGHRARVSSLAWNNHVRPSPSPSPNSDPDPDPDPDPNQVLSSGGRDSQVIHHDVRAAEHRVGTRVTLTPNP